HALEVALVQDQTRRARAPANARRLTGQRRVATPSVVRRTTRRNVKRSRPENPEPPPVLGPLELDGRAEHGFRLEHEARERGRLGVGQALRLDSVRLDGTPARSGVLRYEELTIVSRPPRHYCVVVPTMAATR